MTFLLVIHLRPPFLEYIVDDYSGSCNVLQYGSGQIIITGLRDFEKIEKSMATCLAHMNNYRAEIQPFCVSEEPIAKNPWRFGSYRIKTILATGQYATKRRLRMSDIVQAFKDINIAHYPYDGERRSHYVCVQVQGLGTCNVFFLSKKLTLFSTCIDKLSTLYNLVFEKLESF